jgi:hypothetical protein
MATDYKAGRQHAHLAMSDQEFDRRLGAIEQAFGVDWLTKGDAALARLWQRKDGFAVNQLCLLGDAIAGLNAIAPKWVRDQVDKIESTDANSRRGAMFELLGVNLFRQPPQSIKPTSRNHPGYDAILTTRDGATADISLKSYGTSTHESAFREQGARTDVAFRSFLTRRSEGGVFFAIAKDYPSAKDWDSLRNAIPTLVRGKSVAIDVWAVKFGPLPPDFMPYANSQISYQVFVGAPFHKNESKNLSDKFDAAFANAERHAAGTQNGVRLVLMRIPETMSLSACDQWAKDYLANNPDSPIDGILLYQVATIDQSDGTSVIGHSILWSETARFVAWRKARKPKEPILINLAVGVGTAPSHVQIVNGPANAAFKDGYHYQRGEFYTAYQVDPKQPTNAWVRNLASGIFQHAVIVYPDGKEDVLGGNFPPSKEIALFD